MGFITFTFNGLACLLFKESYLCRSNLNRIHVKWLIWSEKNSSSLSFRDHQPLTRPLLAWWPMHGSCLKCKMQIRVEWVHSKKTHFTRTRAHNEPISINASSEWEDTETLIAKNSTVLAFFYYLLTTVPAHHYQWLCHLNSLIAVKL